MNHTAEDDEMVSGERHRGIFTDLADAKGAPWHLPAYFCWFCRGVHKQFPRQKPFKSLPLCEYKMHENKGLPSARHSTDLFTCVEYMSFPFTDGETEAQEASLTCPRSG